MVSRHSLWLFFAVWLLPFLLSCQGSADAGGARLVLHLRWPAAIEGKRRRSENLTARALYLEVRLLSKEGWRKTLRYPVQQWESMPLTELDFPRSEHDWLKVDVWVWDRARDGRMRRTAALIGKAVLKSSDLPSEGPAETFINLSLKVSAEDYD